MSDYAAHEEAALEEDARRRTEDIRTSEEAMAQAAIDEETSLAPDAEIAQVRRSGRKHDHSDSAADEVPQLVRRRGGPAARRPVMLKTTTFAGQPTAWVECSHTLSGLPCMNHRPHEGNGRGCVHYSRSGVPDRHDYGDDE